jgi:hypothetical protein
MACRSFGFNYAKFRTPLTNIRITAFVCNETEVKVVDPNNLEVIDAVGCTIRDCAVESAPGLRRQPKLIRTACLQAAPPVSLRKA